MRRERKKKKKEGCPYAVKMASVREMYYPHAI